MCKQVVSFGFGVRGPVLSRLGRRAQVLGISGPCRARYSKDLKSQRDIRNCHQSVPLGVCGYGPLALSFSCPRPPPFTARFLEQEQPTYRANQAKPRPEPPAKGRCPQEAENGKEQASPGGHPRAPHQCVDHHVTFFMSGWLSCSVTTTLFLSRAEVARILSDKTDLTLSGANWSLSWR